MAKNPNHYVPLKLDRFYPTHVHKDDGTPVEVLCASWGVVGKDLVPLPHTETTPTTNSLEVVPPGSIRDLITFRDKANDTVTSTLEYFREHYTPYF